MGRNACLFGYNIAGRGARGRDEEMNPKPLKKVSLGAESHVTITGKVFFFFTQSQVSLASIVGDKADGSPSKIFLYHQERVTGGVISSSRIVTKKPSRQVSCQIP